MKTNNKMMANGLQAGLCLLALAALMGCMHHPQHTTLTAEPVQTSSAKRSLSIDANSYGELRHRSLTIVGYNYTDYGFYSYQVDSRGGGNLVPSTPTTGGSKSTCCFSLYTPMSNSRKVKVKWSRGIPQGLWCELEVPLKGPLPAKPEYLEVHFYQDGHVELAITEAPSPPRLQLTRYDNDQRHATGNVINDDKIAVCTHGY